MNAASVNLNPGNATQASLQAGKQADSSAPDTPFSQMLSDEIARNGGEDAETPDAGDAAQQLAASIEAGASSALPAAAEPALDAVPTHSDALPQLPDALLGLAIQTNVTKPAAGDGGIAADPAARLAAALEARSGRSPTAMQAGPDDAAPDTRAGRPGLPAQVEAQANAAAASAASAAFSERLAAARQSDPAMASERLSELMSHPAMRATAQAPLDAAPAADPAGTRLAPTVGTTAWGQALGEKIVWMAAGAQQTASLTLNPPNLGPLQIVLNVTNDQATASFFSAQPEVRQALEAAYPRLREMMDQAGIQLGQATVSADTPRQHDTADRQAQRGALPFGGTDDAPPVALPTLQAPVLQSGRGLVDTFA
jgi:flagellar hook-length control protein FliK